MDSNRIYRGGKGQDKLTNQGVLSSSPKRKSPKWKSIYSEDATKARTKTKI